MENEEIKKKKGVLQTNNTVQSKWKMAVKRNSKIYNYFDQFGDGLCTA